MDPLTIASVASSFASGGGSSAPSSDMISTGAKEGGSGGAYSVPMGGSTYINYKSPNSGEIFKPYNEGSLQNGGNPIGDNRYTSSLRPATRSILDESINSPDYSMLIITAGSILILSFLLRKGKGAR